MLFPYNSMMCILSVYHLFQYWYCLSATYDVKTLIIDEIVIWSNKKQEISKVRVDLHCFANSPLIVPKECELW